MNALRKTVSHLPTRKYIFSRSALTSVTATMMISSSSSLILCEGSNDDSSDILSKVKDVVGGKIDINEGFDIVAKEVGTKVQEAIDSGVPTQISYGFVCGYCSGFALKKVGKAASGVLGLGFMTLQTLNYSGYIEVNHDKMKKTVESAMDFNNDGKVDKEDADLAADKLMEVLSFNMPGGSGFASGFLGGFRSG